MSLPCHSWLMVGNILGVLGWILDCDRHMEEYYWSKVRLPLHALCSSGDGATFSSPPPPTHTHTHVHTHKHSPLLPMLRLTSVGRNQFGLATECPAIYHCFTDQWYWYVTCQRSHTHRHTHTHTGASIRSQCTRKASLGLLE